MIEHEQEAKKALDGMSTDQMNTKFKLATLKGELHDLSVKAAESRKQHAGQQDVNIQALRELMKQVEQREVDGVYGMLIDLVEIKPDVLSAIESLAYNKMFAIAVKDTKTADELVAINRELKGPRISIYPMEWLDEET